MTIPAHWKNHIEAWQASGLSQADYCRRHGLNTNSFSARCHDYRKQALGDPIGLIPVRVVEPARLGSDGPIVLVHALGHRLEFPAAVSPVWLAELLKCLG